MVEPTDLPFVKPNTAKLKVVLPTGMAEEEEAHPPHHLHQPLDPPMAALLANVRVNGDTVVLALTIVVAPLLLHLLLLHQPLDLPMAVLLAHVRVNGATAVLDLTIVVVPLLLLPHQPLDPLMAALQDNARVNTDTVVLDLTIVVAVTLVVENVTTVVVNAAPNGDTVALALVTVIIMPEKLELAPHLL